MERQEKQDVGFLHTFSYWFVKLCICLGFCILSFQGGNRNLGVISLIAMFFCIISLIYVALEGDGKKKIIRTIKEICRILKCP